MTASNFGTALRKWWTFHVSKVVKILQIAVFLAAGIVIVGPVNGYFRDLAKESVFGPAYYEAKARTSAVLSAESFDELRKRSMQLAAWNDRVGMEFLSLKRETGTEFYRFQKAKADLELVLAETQASESDRAYAVFRMRKAAEDVPVQAFRKNETTPEALQRWWILAFALAATVSSIIVSLLGSWIEGASKGFALLRLSASAVGAAIGSSIAGWIIVPMFFNPLF